MNRWLYRAAGTVGIAGGFLLLGAGGAQADETESADALLGDVFSPTSGLPPLDLPAGDVRTPGAGTLILDPDDGRLGEPELLPALPLGGLDSLLTTLPLDSVPLDAAGLPGAAIGTGGPLSGDLLQVDGDLVGLPTRFADTGFRTLPAPAPIGPAPTAAPAPAPVAGGGRAEVAGQPEVADLPEAAGPAEIVGPMPFLTDPLTGALLAGQSLGNVVMIGDLVGQVPVAGPMLSQTAGNLPLVSQIVPKPHPQQPTTPAGVPGLAGPLPTDQLPPVIGQQLAAERGQSPELLDGGLPLIGHGLDPVSRMVGVGNLPKQLPLVGPLAGPMLDGLPVIGDPAPAAPTTPVQGPAIPGERPVAGEDPEYAESTQASGLPL